VRDCQVRFERICVSEHGADFGTHTVRLSSGVPVPSSNAPLDSGDVHIFAVDRLETMAASQADNGWATGHLVLLHSYDATLAATSEYLRNCRSSNGWCDALTALAFHSYSRYQVADSLFALALSQMPAAERCSWRDISQLLDESARAAYNRLDCTAKEAFEDRFWWLSDPLYSLPGNDRRTEHYARRIMDSLFSGAPTPFTQDDDPYSWGNVMGNILVRYGVAAHWIVPGKLVSPGDASDRWLHYHTPAYSFAPRGLSYQPGELVEADSYELETTLSNSLERYHPNYDFVTTLSHYQVVALPRGDSMLVAAAMSVDREPFVDAGPFAVAMYVAASHDGPHVLRTHGGLGGRAHFTATVPRRTSLVGLEVLSNRLLLSGRTRFSVVAPTGDGSPFVSQPVFFAPTEELPRTADSAIGQMFGSTRLIAGAPLGVYWEMSGFTPESEIQITVSVTRTSGASGGFLGLFRRSAPLTTLTSWAERARGADMGTGYSISLDINSLSEGSYRMQLEARSGARNMVMAARTFEIIRRDDATGDLWKLLQQQVPPEDFPTATVAPQSFRSRPQVLQVPW
jgi:hypothetical protein